MLTFEKDISAVKFPEDYPFPQSVLGRGRDFRYVGLGNTYKASHSSATGHVGLSRSNWVSPLYPSARLVSTSPSRNTSLMIVQFYCEEHANIGEAYARFAFCKDVDTLKSAVKRLQRLKEYM